MATSIQAQPRRPKPAASPSDSISTNTTTTANSAQIKRVLKPTVRSASSDANKVSSSDQNRQLPICHKPTKRSPPHESFRYVKKDGQNERNSATQNHKAVVSSGPTRTARRTSLSPGAKTAASPSAKPGQERASKASKPGKIHQLYVKKATLLSNGKETHDPGGSTEISKDVAVDPVLHADNQKTKQEETFVKETKRAEPIEKEVTIPTETVAETEKILVDVSVSEGNEEERKKLQISDISTVSEEEEESQSPSAGEANGSLAEKKDEVGHDGNSGMRIEKDKKEGEELEETKEGDKKEKSRVESEEDENSTEDGEEENMKMVKLGKKESPPAYNEVIEETASKLVEERKNKVKALVGAFETVIDYESSSK